MLYPNHALAVSRQIEKQWDIAVKDNDWMCVHLLFTRNSITRKQYYDGSCTQCIPQHILQFSVKCTPTIYGGLRW